MTSRSSVSPAVARGLAADIGIPANLAVSGGEPSLHAMMAIKQARDAGGGWLREDFLAQAQHHIAGLDPRRNGQLMQHLQGCVIALGGRGGDTQLAHLTPGEYVVPDDLMTPEVVDLLRRAAKEKGLDPERFQVASGRNSINPKTGLMEFDDEEYDHNAEGPASNTPESSAPSNNAPSPSAQQPGDGPYTIQGDATWYNLPTKTATGVPFDPNANAAAMYRPGNIHMGDTVTVQMQKPPYTSITVPINDTGPFERGSDGKALKPLRPDPVSIIDLTPRAFNDLTGDTRIGRVPVTVTRNPSSKGR